MSKDIDPEMRDLANKNFKKLLVDPPQETGIDELAEDHFEFYPPGTTGEWRRFKQALLRLIEEKVIGKDEHLHQIMTKELRQRGGEYAEALKERMQGRNALKAEQRSKLRELLGGDKT